MGCRCSEDRHLMVGDKRWSYRIVYDDNWETQSVKVCDESGRYVTEFRDTDELRGYLKKDGSEKRIEALKAIQRFRSRVWPDAMYGEEQPVGISGEEKAEGVKAFMQRIAMLQGDMSMSEFGRALGIDASMAYGYVKGRRFPGGYALRRIADRCGVTVDWLLGRD